MKGIVITITGIDGSGKGTQAKLLYEHLKRDKYNVKLISFPNYEDVSAGPIKEFLSGKLKLTPQQAANLYIVNFSSTLAKENIDKFLNEGGIVIFDRYTESNLVHQASRIQDFAERARFENTLKQIHRFVGLPKPDATFLLDTPLNICLERIAKRNQNLGFKNGTSNDVLEKKDALKKAYNNSTALATFEGWKRIPGADLAGNARSVNDVHKEIYLTTLPIIKSKTKAPDNEPANSL